MRTLVILLLLALGCACSREDAAAPEPQITDEAEYDVESETGLAVNPSKRRLPNSVRIISDTKENFGIDLSTLSPDEASIVRSAWANYQLILSGGRADCPEAPFAPSDGGTTIYFCDGYDMMRVHGLSGTVEAPGYEYGPEVDFLNGQRTENLKFYTDSEMAEIDRSLP